MIQNFDGVFLLPGAQVTDQLCRSELRQARFSWDFCCPLVTTVLNVTQIANEIVALFKTEFFSRIGQKQTVEAWSKAPFILSTYQSRWSTVGRQSKSDQLRGEIPAALHESRIRAKSARNV